MKNSKLLVPVDYSEDSRKALEYAALLAVKLKASIHVLHVWECMPQPPRDLRVDMGKEGTRSLFDVIQENAEKEFAAFMAEIELPEGVQVEHSILSGEPSRRILETAEAGDYAWIVMGSRGRGAIEHFILGSVAERVVRLSPIPVITVPFRASTTGKKPA